MEKTESSPQELIERAESTLREKGWKKFSNGYYSEAETYFKVFDTPTKCALNRDQPGIRVGVSIYAFLGGSKPIIMFSLFIQNQLKDGTNVRLENYDRLDDINKVLNQVPRLIKSWECIANG